MTFQTEVSLRRTHERWLDICRDNVDRGVASSVELGHATEAEAEVDRTNRRVFLDNLPRGFTFTEAHLRELAAPVFDQHSTLWTGMGGASPKSLPVPVEEDDDGELTIHDEIIKRGDEERSVSISGGVGPPITDIGDAMRRIDDPRITPNWWKEPDPQPPRDDRPQPSAASLSTQADAAKR